MLNLTDLLQNLLYVVLTVMLPIIAKFTVSCLKALKLNSDNRLLNDYINSALNIICDIVVFVNQYYVDELKKAGNFTKENAEEAFKKAKELAQLLISDKMKSAIMTVYGDFDDYITTQIEAAVNKNKRKVG